MPPRSLPLLLVAAALAAAPLPAFALGAGADASDTLSLDPSKMPIAYFGTPKNTDYAARLTLYWDNDGGFAKPIDRHDRHYTAGAGASLAFQAPWVNSLLSKVPTIANEFDPTKTDYAMGAAGDLTIYTPQHYELRQPIDNDRPFAGYTYAGLFAQRANRFNKIPVFESLEVDVGILGPSSLAQNAQQLVHGAFDYTRPKGWNNQINDEPEFSIKYNRRWRFDVWTPPESWHPWAPRLQVLPEVGLTAGTLLDEAHAGAVARIGWNLPDDFGPGSLATPEDFTGRAACSCEPFGFEDILKQQSFYLFARPYGQVVARNSLLEGDAFSDRDPVTASPSHALFGVEYGLSHRFLKYFEFTYSWNSLSPEFKGQHNWDTYGSLQLSFSIAW